jgi:hypothetical protein
MGSLSDHHVLLDLRHATIPPIPESQLAQALGELSRRGIGVANKVAIVFDPADSTRAMRFVRGEELAVRMGVRFRSFDDTSDALEWLSCPCEQRQFGFPPSKNLHFLEADVHPRMVHLRAGTSAHPTTDTRREFTACDPSKPALRARGKDR